MKGVCQGRIEIEIYSENIILAIPLIGVRIEIECIQHSEPFIINLLMTAITAWTYSLQNGQRGVPKHLIKCGLTNIDSGG